MCISFCFFFFEDNLYYLDNKSFIHFSIYIVIIPYNIFIIFTTTKWWFIFLSAGRFDPILLLLNFSSEILFSIVNFLFHCLITHWPISRVVPGLAHGIRCYKCGQYNEGVGSITPCINYTAHMHLKECPPSAEWCIVSKHIYFTFCQNDATFDNTRNYVKIQFGWIDALRSLETIFPWYIYFEI